MVMQQKPFRLHMQSAHSCHTASMRITELEKKGIEGIAAGRSSSSDREPIQSNSAVSDGWQVKCNCSVTDDDGEPMAECEGGCKTWVHLKCHNIQLGQDWYCDKCLEAVHTSKAPSEGVDDPMDESAGAAGASPGSAPGTNAPAGISALEAEKSRPASRSPADGALAKEARADMDGKGSRAVAGCHGIDDDTEVDLTDPRASSPDQKATGSRAVPGSTGDVQLDSSATASPDAKASSQTKSKKVST